MEGKICRKCNIFKTIDEFNKESKVKDGYKASCKECIRPIILQHYYNNKKRYKQAYQEFIERNPDYQANYYRKNIKLNLN